MPPPTCFICQGTACDDPTSAYRRCPNCGHETLAASEAQAYIINEALREEEVRRESFLDRFQGRVLNRCSVGRRRRHLVDIGSGSGKFLLHHGSAFERRHGIEITPAAVEFSQRKLGLTIVADLPSVPGEIDVATAWHSLEHFPSAALTTLLAGLAAQIPAGGCVIVSVPNAASFQARLFRSHNAFYDVPNHLHQFTPDSLCRLFAHHGFDLVRSVRSWPYNVFGWVQALLNLVMPGHNYLYYRLKRGQPRASRARDLAGFGLLPLVVPLGALLSLLDAAWPARQGVLTCCFERRA